MRSESSSDWTCVQSLSAAAPLSLPSSVALARFERTCEPEMRSWRESSVCVRDMGT